MRAGKRLIVIAVDVTDVGRDRIGGACDVELRGARPPLAAFAAATTTCAARGYPPSRTPPCRSARRAVCLRRARPGGGRWRCRRSTSTSSIDALAPSGNRMSRPPNFMSSSTTTIGPAKRARVRSRSTDPSAARSANRVGTVHSPWRFSEPSTPAQLHPVGRRGDDGARPGQVADELVELGTQAGPRHQRRALLELVDVDQPERHGVVQPPQCAVAVGVGDAQRRGLLIDTRHAPSCPSADRLLTPDSRAAIRRACRLHIRTAYSELPPPTISAANAMSPR